VNAHGWEQLGIIFQEQQNHTQSNIAPKMGMTCRKEVLLTKEEQSVLKCKKFGLKLHVFHD